jgi:8-oxo-dGTP pyrophosphatase MutT (NUDIX family)
MKTTPLLNTRPAHFPEIARLRAALRDPLPGLPVQMGMAPIPRPGTERILDPSLDCRRAGVLVLLYPHLDTLCLVLTRRTDSVDNHRGQISFPGGSMDPGEDAVATALREAYEELAVDPARVEVLGKLSPLYIPPSGFCVFPVVGYAEARPAFAPSITEVAEVLEASLNHLLDPATRQEEIWPIRGQNVRVPFYAIGAHKVWGATAMVLCELLMLLRKEQEL